MKTKNYQTSPFRHVIAHCDIEIEDTENAIENYPGNDSELEDALDEAKKTDIDLRAELREHRAAIRLMELAESIPFDQIMRADKMVLSKTEQIEYCADCQHSKFLHDKNGICGCGGCRGFVKAEQL